MRKHRVQTAAGLAITVGLLYWVLRDVSLAAVWAEVRQSNGWLLLLATATATASFVLRAFRWHVLLLPGFATSSFRARFAAVCIGFMTNNLLPARLGEFARAYSFSRVEPIGIARSLASLVVERVFDAVVLALFFVIPLWAGSLSIASSGAIRTATAVAVVVMALGLISLWAMARWPKRALALFEHTVGRVLSPRLTDRAIGILGSFIEGLGALHNPVVFAWALAWSLVVWLCIALSVWLGLLAFDIQQPGFVGSMFVQGVIGFAVAVPSSPGFFGPFEAASRLALGAYGVDSVRIVSFATTYHILTFIPVTLMGIWFLQRLGIAWSDVGHSEDLVEEAVEGTDPRHTAAGDTPRAVTASASGPSTPIEASSASEDTGGT